MPVVVNILKQEKEMNNIEEDTSYGYLYTSAPSDLIKILADSFEVVLSKRIKDLILKTLKMF